MPTKRQIPSALGVGMTKSSDVWVRIRVKPWRMVLPIRILAGRVGSGGQYGQRLGRFFWPNTVNQDIKTTIENRVGKHRGRLRRNARVDRQDGITR